jgi:hypothetical protein
MTQIAVLSLLLGALLGARFTVYMLVPAICLVLAFVVLAGLVHGDDFWSLAICAGLATVGMQLGYVAGTFIPLILSSRRAHKYRLTSDVGDQIVP